MKVVFQESLPIGESDQKILTYIKRDENDSNYLVVSCDSDMLPLICFHLKSILHPTKLTFSNQVFIDTKALHDKNATRDYRYVNVTKLYQSIIKFFETEFKGITNPVECFFFIFLSYYTDYNTPFPSKLRIVPTALWNTFSFLHCTNKAGYIPYCIDNIKKARVPQCSSNFELKNILHDAISITPFNQDIEYTEVGSYSSSNNLGFFSNYFVISFDRLKIKTFYCFLFQEKLYKKFNMKKYIFEYNDLYNFVTSRADSDEKALQLKSIKKTSLTQIDTKKAYDQIESLNMKNQTSTTIKINLENIRNVHNKNRNLEDVTALLNYQSNDNNNNTSRIDQRKNENGLLTNLELDNRISMLMWIMNYFQNGWNSVDFSQSYHLTHHRTNISLNGWKLVRYDRKNSRYPISSNYIIKILNTDFKGKQQKSIYDIYDLFTVEYDNTQ
jgi:hypothetical protein